MLFFRKVKIVLCLCCLVIGILVSALQYQNPSPPQERTRETFTSLSTTTDNENIHSKQTALELKKFIKYTNIKREEENSIPKRRLQFFNILNYLDSIFNLNNGYSDGRAAAADKSDWGFNGMGQEGFGVCCYECSPRNVDCLTNCRRNC